MKPIDTKAIRADVRNQKAGMAIPKAAFSDVLGGASAFGPASAELASQWSGGSQLAGAVLNAAFSGIDAAAASSMASSGASTYSPYSTMPGVMGSPRMTTQTGIVKAGTDSSYSGVPKFGSPLDNTAGAIDDPATYKHDLMQTLNSNNLKLLELQALMQSNMQSWTTRSNILSADHRARMSMIEKFTARG